MSAAADAVSAAILAGGQSTRMGRDKALIPIDGIPMIRRILTTLHRVCDQVVVISNRAAAYDFLQVPVYPDLIPDRGPASGIHSALAHAQSDLVLVVPCDMPFLSEEMFRYILTCPDPGDACVIEAGGIRNPLCGLYHRRILPVIQQEMLAGRHTPQYLLDRVKARTIVVSQELSFFTPQLLMNINSETDLHGFRSAGIR